MRCSTALIPDQGSFWEGNEVLLTGGAGFLGSNIMDQLRARGVDSATVSIPRSRDTDLRNWKECRRTVKGKDIVIHLAAKVGGIGFNQANPGSLFYDNAIMGIQILEAARLEDVKKCVIIGTVCAYPKFTPVPFREDEIWNGYPEETNAPYGLAKKMLLVQAQAYRAQYGMDIIYLIPVNLYGPGDTFDPAVSHVIPALIKKFVDAMEERKSTIEVWGTGGASREFLFVKDAARAIVMATERYSKPDPVNLGAGKEITIHGLVEMIRELTGFSGDISWDHSKPDGQPRRSLDTSRAKREFGFEAVVPFRAGLQQTIEWYRDTYYGKRI
ncbi:MAG: GDP-L-fucose synthase [Methanomicrobiales archaeon]|nr:GDP-L-fucose synthase [Methanomicrobiales archaeon]